LQVGLPGLVRRADQVADVAGVDRVQRVFFLGVIQWDAEGAPAGDREAEIPGDSPVVADQRRVGAVVVGEATCPVPP